MLLLNNEMVFGERSKVSYWTRNSALLKVHQFQGLSEAKARSAGSSAPHFPLLLGVAKLGLSAGKAAFAGPLGAERSCPNYLRRSYCRRLMLPD